MAPAVVGLKVTVNVVVPLATTGELVLVKSSVKSVVFELVILEYVKSADPKFSIVKVIAEPELPDTMLPATWLPLPDAKLVTFCFTFISGADAVTLKLLLTSVNTPCVAVKAFVLAGAENTKLLKVAVPATIATVVVAVPPKVIDPELMVISTFEVLSKSKFALLSTALTVGEGLITAFSGKLLTF